PFRIALPTYEYRVAFHPGGEVAGIEAEGPPRAWPAGTILKSFRPDPAALAALVHDWNRDRPACLEGLIWYRLPVRAHKPNWRRSTLVAVMQGLAPQARLRIEQSGRSPTDLVLVNDGDMDASLPARIAVSSTSAVTDADGVGGYRSELSGEAGAVFLRG